jgi:hypothetical protein
MATLKSATVYFEPDVHRALRLRAAVRSYPALVVRRIDSASFNELKR